MHRVALTYELGSEPPGDRSLHHSLLQLLQAVRETGSIAASARRLGLSYRHVWGELKRWETELGQPLVRWVKGQPALLAPFGEQLLAAERRALARLAPQIEALRGALEQAFARAFDPGAGVVPIAASLDDALPKLRALAQAEHRLLLDLAFCSSVDALTALNEGRCQLAFFHVIADAAPRSPTARAWQPLLQPGRHKLVGFARRSQGLIVAAGNPQRIERVADLTRPGVRFANRARGSATRLVLEDLLAAAGVKPADIDGFERGEASHAAVAEAVAGGHADAAFGLGSFASSRGLGFVPLTVEHGFFVGRSATFAEPPVQALLGLLASPAWHATLNAIPGHAADRCGELLSLRRVLPWWKGSAPKG